MQFQQLMLFTYLLHCIEKCHINHFRFNKLSLVAMIQRTLLDVVEVISKVLSLMLKNGESEIEICIRWTQELSKMELMSNAQSFLTSNQII